MKKHFLIFFALMNSVLSFSQISKSDSLIIQEYIDRGSDLFELRPDSSEKLYKYVISKLDEKSNSMFLATAYLGLANINNKKTININTALTYYNKALSIFESLKDSTKIMATYSNLSRLMLSQMRDREALNYLNKSIPYFKRNNVNYYIISLVSASDIYCSLDKPDSAIYILKDLADFPPKNIEPQNLALLYNNLANSYYNLVDITHEQKYFTNALFYAKKSFDILKENKNYISVYAYSAGLIGAINLELKKYQEAEHYYLICLQAYSKSKDYNSLLPIYTEMTELYIMMGDKEKAVMYFTKHDSLFSYVYSENNSSTLSEMQTKYETDKKKKENELLHAENKLSVATIKQQKLVSYFIVGGLILVSLLAFFIFNGLKKQRKANAIISEQKKEVELQKHLIEEHQKETIDSINYAKRIQYALLANKELLVKNLPEHFVLFKPKDIVSGDFYWATEHNGKFYLAVCDSTGHGVPGAFMSLLNMGFLSEAIKEKNIVQPNEILNYVRKRLIESIGNEGQQDGMDCILTCIDDKVESKTITYAAANNEPILIRDNEVLSLPKDKMPVGKGEKMESFTLQSVDLKEGDVLYLYTDGYADQFGGPRGKKFKYKPLNDLLLVNSAKNMNEQSELLVKEFDKWKGDLEQVDDVCIIGIKI